MADPGKIFLFRMTHIDNIPHIIENGITHIDSANANNGYVPIGDSSLISNRSSFEMPNGNTLGQYIPFYFGARMPMLYVIQKGFNGVRATAPENIIYCVSSVSRMLASGIDFVFTDGHAVDSFSTFYTIDDIENIETLIDQSAIASRYWIDENDLDKKRRKEAEFLAAGDIPVAAIGRYIVYNNAAKEKMIGFGVDEAMIIVKPDYYF